MSTPIREPGDRPRRRTFHGDPPFLLRFVFGFVVGVIAGVVVYYRFVLHRTPPDWAMTPSPWPMVGFVALCGITGGLLAGFFKRAKPGS